MNKEAYDAGYDSYWDGAEVASNPHDPDVEVNDYQSWDAGWRKGRVDDYDESD